MKCGASHSRWRSTASGVASGRSHGGPRGAGALDDGGDAQAAERQRLHQPTAFRELAVQRGQLLGHGVDRARARLEDRRRVDGDPLEAHLLQLHARATTRSCSA
jgi:hypothetical protein